MIKGTTNCVGRGCFSCAKILGYSKPMGLELIRSPLQWLPLQPRPCRITIA